MTTLKPDPPFVELDVREDLRQGREPFTRIMAAVATLRPGEGLCLHATFEPVPLFKVMKKHGFDHRAEELGADHWRVRFTRPEQVLDVRDLEPPLPLQQTLEALETLPAGAVLVQVNQRVPQFLLPILTERGFEYDIYTPEPERVVVRIWRATALPPPSHSDRSQVMPASSATELDVRPIPPRDKHPTIFRTFDGLQAGQAMLLINDHDPAPLRYQLMAERANQFDWSYLEQGPEVWRVRIEHK